MATAVLTDDMISTLRRTVADAEMDRLDPRQSGTCARCSGWHDEPCLTVTGVALTPGEASNGTKRNLHNARALFGKAICGECADKLRRRDGGKLIKFYNIVPNGWDFAD